MIKTFRGGTHVVDYKWLTEDLPIKQAPIPKKVRIPLSQHTGKPASPVVVVGDIVKTGQLIASAQGLISSNIHSSITGKVTAIDRFPEPIGGEYLSIEIEGDGRDEVVGLDGEASNIVQRVQDAGIVGMGGAMFPTHVKLQPPKDKKIDAVILNGAECEPFVTSDYRLMIERPDIVLEGLRIIMQAVGAERAVIGIESNKPEAIRIMKEKVQDVHGGKRSFPPHDASLSPPFLPKKHNRLKGKNFFFPLRIPFFLKHRIENPMLQDIEVIVLKAKYPQGGEKQLIKAMLNREVPSGKLPFDVGVIVQNIGTAVAIYEAVKLAKPLYERIVTVTGSCVKEPANWRTRIGTLVSDLIDWSGGLKAEPGKLIIGGPMMGIAQYTFDVPVIKGTNAILVLARDEVKEVVEEACIRCGKCIVGCPMGLDPGKLGTLIEKGKLEEAKEIGALDCIECGICAYTCPANRNLVQLIKYAKRKK